MSMGASTLGKRCLSPGFGVAPELNVSRARTPTRSPMPSDAEQKNALPTGRLGSALSTSPAKSNRHLALESVAALMSSGWLIRSTVFGAASVPCSGIVHVSIYSRPVDAELAGEFSLDSTRCKPCP